MSIVQDLEVNNRQLLSNTERMRTELDRVVQVTLTEKIWSASFLLPSIIVLLGTIRFNLPPKLMPIKAYHHAPFPMH